MKYVKVGGLWPPQKKVPGLKATGSLEVMVKGERKKIPVSLWANESENEKAPKFNIKVGLPDDVPEAAELFVSREPGSNKAATEKKAAASDDGELF